VRLGDIATVRVAPYPTVIRHDATLRSLDVSAGVRGRDLDAVLGDVKSRIETVQMPLEYHTEVLSDLAEQQSQDLQTAGLAIAVAIGILLLLQAALGSWRLAVLAFLTLPLAGAGGVVAASFVGGVMTLGALIGLFAVVAIAVRNGVVLLSSYQRLASGPGVAPDAESILRVTRDRVGAILLTAGGTTAVFLPLVLFGSMAGLEVLFQLAAVVLGGLVTSTLLTVFVLPALYLRLWSAAHPDRPSVEPATAVTSGRSAGSTDPGRGPFR
jgi:Cu/Ag efflux pump CusA